MKDHSFLMDAMEHIDDDLIEAAAHPKRKPFPLGACLCAVAACLIVVIGFSLLPGPGDVPSPPSVTVPQPGQTLIMENLWQREDFSVFSLSYQPQAPSPMNYISALSSSSNGVSSQNLVISTDQTIKFETLIAQRYAVFYSDTGYPVFYDTQEDRKVDLQERILGDTNSIFIEHTLAAEAKANTDYPDMLRSERNRRLFWEYLYAISRDLPLKDIVAQSPDTAFLDLYGWENADDEAKITEFWTRCWACYAGVDTGLYGQLYNINILGIDAAGGLCILRATDLYGNVCAYLVYDIKTDSFSDLPEGFEMFMSTDGYIFQFSSDSSIATVAFPDANFSGGNLYLDLTHRFTIPSEERFVSNYRGERLCVFFLNAGKAQKLSGVPGASKLYVSTGNHVLYYKQITEEQAGKSFHASDAVWFNRLELYAADTDRWVFHTVSDECEVSNGGIVLQGNFVRFANQETIAIMEREGSCFAYSLEDGRDITEDIKTGMITMYAHEQMQPYLENSCLYRKNLFDAQEPEVICKADRIVVSDDGAFVFTYCRGDRYVTCYNVATLESCSISMEQQLCDQLFDTEGATLQMNYNPSENTLLLSFYVEAQQNTENTSDVDFYDLLRQLNDQDPFDTFPENPTIITDYTVSEEIMDSFRDSMQRYLNPDGVISWEKYYPEFLSIYEGLDTICKKLGLDFSQVALDVNGTQFVLYKDEDEELTLTFYQFWGLFDYNDRSAGFEIQYQGKRICNFNFRAFAMDDTNAPPASLVLPFEIPPAPEPELSIMMPPVIIPGEPLSTDQLDANYGPVLFDPEVDAGQPLPLSDDIREQIMAQTEDLLATKNYTPEAARLIRDTVQQLCYTYCGYESLFALLDVPDAENYIRNAVLGCLEREVDTVCFPCKHSNIMNTNLPGGYGDNTARTLHVTYSSNAAVNAAMFLRGLSDIRSADGHYSFTPLTNGYRHLCMLTMMTSERYGQFSNVYAVGLRYRDPNNPDHFLQYGQFMGYSESFYTGLYFRLFALTDYTTMEQAFLFGCDDTLRTELVRRYGNEGGKLFDGLMRQQPYDELGQIAPLGQQYELALENESLFLKLFAKRLNMVQTKEDMTSYLQLYRFYRQMFSLMYVYEYNAEVNGTLECRTLELDHPKLDYRKLDLAVAQAAVDHHIFNDAAVPANLQLSLAHGLVSRRKAFSYVDNRENVNALNADSLLLLHPRFRYWTISKGYAYIIYSYPNSRISFSYSSDGAYSYNG